MRDFQIKRQAKKITGSIRESAAKHHLLKRGARFTTDDVEDLVSEAWLEQHCEEALLAVLDRAGLEHSPKYFEYAHQLLDRELSDTEAAKVSHRVAQRWIDNKKRLREVSMQKVIGHSADGEELLLEATLRQAESVTDKNHVVLNDRCTPEQLPFQQDWVIYQSPEDKAMQQSALSDLSEQDRIWLWEYEDIKGRKGVHTAADRQKAFKLRRKVKKAVLKAKEIEEG